MDTDKNDISSSPHVASIAKKQTNGSILAFLSRFNVLSREETAYILPMAIFLAFTFAGGHWPKFFTVSYVLKTFLAAGALIYFRRNYTKITWNHWWLGIIVGVVGIVQWIGMEKLILHYWPNYIRLNAELFNVYEKSADGSLTHFPNAATMWAFIIIRWAGAAFMVPFMEELFWRDYLWRTTLAPNNFRLASIGEWAWQPFLIVTAFFASVHIQWITAFTWGAMIAWLLVYTRSIGACIIAHGVTNLLLGAYVQYTSDWYFW